MQQTQQNQKTVFGIMVQDHDSKVVDNAFLTVNVDKDGGYHCSLADRDGKALSGEWTATKDDFERRLGEKMNTVYGEGMSYKAFLERSENGPSVDKVLAAAMRHFGWEPEYNGKGVYSGIANIPGNDRDQAQIELQKRVREALEAKTIAEAQRQRDENARHAEEQQRQESQKKNPEQARAVSIQRRSDAKMAMTVLVGGAVVNAAVSRSDVEKLSALPEGKQAAMLQKMIPQMDFRNANPEAVRNMVTAITTAAANPGTQVGISRPEVYASAMASQTETSSQLMQGLASSAYENTTAPSQSETLSQGRGL